MLILEFLVKRIAQGALIVVITSLIIFTLLRVVPGDPVRLMVGRHGATRTLSRQVATRMGLRDPIIVQYGRYMGRSAARGDMGQSYLRPRERNGHDRRTSMSIPPGPTWRRSPTSFSNACPITLQLGALALVLRPSSCRFPIGIAGGLHPKRLAEHPCFRGAVAVRLDSEFLAGDHPDSVPVGEARIFCRRSATRASPSSILPAFVLAVEITPLHRPHDGDLARRGDAGEVSSTRRACAACRAAGSSIRMRFATPPFRSSTSLANPTLDADRGRAGDRIYLRLSRARQSHRGLGDGTGFSR